jgi:hypothetical protein
MNLTFHRADYRAEFVGSSVSACFPSAALLALASLDGTSPLMIMADTPKHNVRSIKIHSRLLLALDWLW